MTAPFPERPPESPAAPAGAARAAGADATWARIGAVVVCVFVVGLVAARSIDRRATVDLLFDDETQYLWNGVNLVNQGLPSADLSPLYAVWYWLQAQVIPDRVDVYYANWSLAMLALLGAVALALARLRLPPVVRVVALAVLACMSLMDAWPYVTHFGAAFVALAFGLALSRGSGAGGLLAASAALAVGSFIRPELGVVFWTTWVAAAAGALARRRRLRSLSVVGLPLLLFAALVAAFGNPLGGDRSFAAFGRYYMLNLAHAQHSQVDTWNLEFVPEIRRHFGDATSIWQAALAHPRAVAWHVKTNLVHSGALLEQIGPQKEIKDATYRLFRATMALVAVGLALAAFRALRAGRPGVPPAERREARVVSLIVALVGVPLFLPILLVSPTPSHAFGLIVVLVLLAAWGWRPLAARVPFLHGSPRRQTLAALLIGAALLAVVPGRRGTGVWWRPQGTAPVLTNLATIGVLRDLPPPAARPVRILESEFSRAVYTGWSFRRIDQRSCTPFAACMAREDPDVIVCDRRLEDHYRLAGDTDFFALVAAPGRWGYRRLSVPGSAVVVISRSTEPAPGAKGVDKRGRGPTIDANTAVTRQGESGRDP